MKKLIISAAVIMTAFIFLQSCTTQAPSGPGGTPTATPTVTQTPFPCSGADFFGNSGNVNTYGRPKNGLNMSRFYNPDMANIAGFTVYVIDVGGNSGSVRAGLYGDSGGEPVTLLAETQEVFCVAGSNDLNLALPVIVAPGYYWIGIISDTDNMCYDFDTTAVTSHYRQYAQAFGPFPAVLPAYLYPEEKFDILAYARYSCP